MTSFVILVLSFVLQKFHCLSSDVIFSSSTFYIIFLFFSFSFTMDSNFTPLFDVFLTCFHLFSLSLSLFLSCVFFSSVWLFSHCWSLIHIVTVRVDVCSGRFFECHACSGHVSNCLLFTDDGCVVHWAVLTQPHHLVSFPTLLWWGVTSDHMTNPIWAVDVDFLLRAFVYVCIWYFFRLWWFVSADVTGNVVKSVWRDPDLQLRQDIAAPTTVFRIWEMIDRGHFAEIVWFGRGVRDTLNAVLEEAGTWQSSDWPPCGLVPLVCGRSLHWLRWNRRWATSSNRVINDANMIGPGCFFFAWSAVMWFS